MTLTVKQLLHSIKQTDGNVTRIADGLGINRSTVYRKIQKHEVLQEALEDARESLVDLAETKLRQEVNKGNITAIIFTLKTQGKKRGYVERQELTGADGEKLKVEVEYVNDPTTTTGIPSWSIEN
jgi:transposase-like protein